MLADALAEAGDPQGARLQRVLGDPDLQPVGIERFQCGDQTHDVLVVRFRPFAESIALPDDERAPDTEFVLVPPFGGDGPGFLVARTCVSRRVFAPHTPEDERLLPATRLHWHEWSDWAAMHDLRFPTLQEWRRAALGGSDGPYGFGERLDASQASFGVFPGMEALGDIAMEEVLAMIPGMPDLRPLTARPVGSLPPNAFGLFEVHGTVWEWINAAWDWPEDPALMGGSWHTTASGCAADRPPRRGAGRRRDCGLRPVRGLDPLHPADVPTRERFAQLLGRARGLAQRQRVCEAAAAFVQAWRLAPEYDDIPGWLLDARELLIASEPGAHATYRRLLAPDADQTDRAAALADLHLAVLLGLDEVDAWVDHLAEQHDLSDLPLHDQLVVVEALLSADRWAAAGRLPPDLAALTLHALDGPGGEAQAARLHAAGLAAERAEGAMAAASVLLDRHDTAHARLVLLLAARRANVTCSAHASWLAICRDHAVLSAQVAEIDSWLRNRALLFGPPE